MAITLNDEQERALRDAIAPLVNPWRVDPDWEHLNIVKSVDGYTIIIARPNTPTALADCRRMAARIRDLLNESEARS